MDNTISKLLGESTLPPELLASLQEAFDKRVIEMREQAEATVRAEMAARFEHDKGTLVEAMDRMLSDVVAKHEQEKSAAVAKFMEARKAFREAKSKCMKQYKAKVAESAEASRKFVIEQLRREVTKLREARKGTLAERLRVAESLDEEKARLAAEQAKALKAMESFVVRMTDKELREFHEDKRALVEARVKVVKEAKGRLKETQTRFVKEAAKKVERVIGETLKREMTQLHEDLERNRQNMFGRRIFEAVAAEFMTSYLAEGTEVRKVQKMLETKQKELADAKAKLAEASRLTAEAARKAKLAEERASRSKIMSELLSNLKGEKRAVMEAALDTVKTEALREHFKKLLPVVLNEGIRKATPAPTTPAGRKPLVEDRISTKPVVTGDRANRLSEAARAERADDAAEMKQVLRLAGLAK